MTGVYLLESYANRGLNFSHGEGAYLFTENGEKYLDFISNYGANVLGYRHPILTNALKDQLDKITNLHGSFESGIRNMAAEIIVKKAGGKLSKVYFSNSGTEAMEAALKFALIASGKNKLIAVEHSYHGKTLGSLALTHHGKYRNGLEENLMSVEFVKFNDLESLEKAVDKKTAAVIIEPIQGEGGINIPSRGYLEQVQELCKINDVLLVLDEIQTGSGRTGFFLASQAESVTPDIVAVSKGLGAGIPVGATLLSEEVAVKIPRLIQTSTFGGSPLSCRAAFETTNILTEDFLKNIKTKGEKLLSRINDIKSTKIKEARGAGLMIGIELYENRMDVLKKLQHNRILAGPAGENVIRLLPPYIIEEPQIDEFITGLCAALS